MFGCIVGWGAERNDDRSSDAPPVTKVSGGCSPDSSERRPAEPPRSAGELVVVLRLGSSVTSGTEGASVRRNSSDAPGRTGRLVTVRAPPWQGRGTPQRPTTWAPTW